MLVSMNSQRQNQQVVFEKIVFKKTGNISKNGHLLRPYTFFKTKGMASCSGKIHITSFLGPNTSQKLRNNISY